jgi:hypothetical protein
MICYNITYDNGYLFSKILQMRHGGNGSCQLKTGKSIWSTGFAYMDVGEREHDCMDAGGRPKTAPAFSALTSKDGGNAARLPGAIAATTSL